MDAWVFVLHIHPDTDLDEAWQFLERDGLTPLYIEQDEGRLAKIYTQIPAKSTLEDILKHYPFIAYAEKEELGKIDWQEQWKIHGLNFHDGYVHVDLPQAVNEDWTQIRLMPGAGFGDLSHPTTRLILKMMETSVQNHYAIDIGCGSGVLALCAVAMGAKHVDAIDIDPQALEHAKENAKLNHMQKKISFFSTENFYFNSKEKEGLILMNMVIAEQQEAWNKLQALHSLTGIAIVSGLLIEQKTAYLELAKHWNWKLIDEQEESGWIGLKFKMNGQSLKT